MSSHEHVIAIDGPAAAGKSTVARLLADHTGALLFDTGALYRAVALAALRRNVSPDDGDALAQLVHGCQIEIRPPSTVDGRLYDVLLDGEDVTWKLRGPEVGAIVSAVAEKPQVRAALLPLQRRIASSGPVVMVGRDIGTVVVPDAGVKIYLDASLNERARRRYAEAAARDSGVTFQEILSETILRDTTDSDRLTAPLRAAPDAIRIDTDAMPIADVVVAIEQIARQRREARGAASAPA